MMMLQIDLYLLCYTINTKYMDQRASKYIRKNVKLNASNNDNKKDDNDNGSGRRRNHNLDDLDIKIIDELLEDATISSSAIASKYRTPLSTIQRRRASLEAMSMVKHQYTLQPINFRFRPVECWVLVKKGKAEELAKTIFDKFENVLQVTVHINSISNDSVLGYVSSSEQLYAMIEEIKSMPFAEDVEFAETVKVVAER